MKEETVQLLAEGGAGALKMRQRRLGAGMRWSDVVDNDDEMRKR